MFWAGPGGPQKRTSGLSMPMPKATVATMTMPSSRRKRSWWRWRTFGVQAGVIRQGGEALLVQPVGGFFHLAAALAVDDAGVAVVLVADEAQQLLARVVLFDQGVADVGPVEAADEDAGVLQLQALDHVGTGVVVGGGGQSQARHVREACVQHAELQIVFTEVVAPLADAVRLVDGEQAEQAALVQAGQLRLKAQVGDALGRRRRASPCGRPSSRARCAGCLPG